MSATGCPSVRGAAQPTTRSAGSSCELDHLGVKGLSACPGEELEPLAGPPVVIADDDPWRSCSGRAEVEGLEVADEDVFAVIEALLAHLERHRRRRPEVDGPVDPDS